MNKEVKVLVSIGIATAFLIAGAVFLLGKSATPQVTALADPNLLIRDDSYKRSFPADRISSDSAKVAVVEFSDFQCPACGAAFPIVKKIEADYQGKINFVYRHFPLPQHKNGFKSALAAEAAGVQSKFWEMHDKLFENQDKWGEEDNPVDTFVSYAIDLGLDTNKFKQDMNDKKLTDKINRDQSDGTILGVNSTPTFFINGQKFPGVLNYSDFKNKIDSELAK